MGNWHRSFGNKRHKDCVGLTLVQSARVWNQVHTQWVCSYPVPNVTIVSLNWAVFVGHDIKDYQWGKRNWKKCEHYERVIWRLPLVSEYPRKEKKKSGIEKSKPRKSADPRKKLMSVSCLQASVTHTHTHTYTHTHTHTPSPSHRFL